MILIVWFGVKSALSASQGVGGGFQFAKFADLILMISFGLGMLTYYSTPIPGVGYSFGDPLHKAYARWQFRLEHDGIDPTLATMVRLVSDGLWFSSLIGTPALDAAMVKRILEQLEAETRTNGVKHDIVQ